MAISVMSYHLLKPLAYSYVISNYKLIFLNYSFLFAWVDPISYIAIGACSIGNECVLQQLFFVKKSIFLTSVFRFLGNISYSIYLIHPLIFFNVKGFIANNLKYGSEVVLNIILISITILVSTITYNIIERPCIALGKKIIVSTK